eukprot:9082498-Lingulodinium_polyedra.AAC.1
MQKNILHVGATLFLDPGLLEQVKLLHAVLFPLKHWHGKQNNEARSPSEFLAFYVAQAQGQWLKPFLATAALLGVSDTLEALEFHLVASATRD